MQKALVATLMMLGATLTHAQTVADGNAPDYPPDVRDARGHEVGALWHFHNSYGALVTQGGTRFVAPLEPNRIGGDPTDINAPASGSEFIYRIYDSLLYYTSADCSGNPIVNGDEGPTPTTIVRDGQNVIAYVAGNVPSQSYSVASQYSTDTQACTALTTPQARTGWIAASKIVLSHNYPEPLMIGY
jgi:hypothetical protein